MNNKVILPHIPKGTDNSCPKTGSSYGSNTSSRTQTLLSLCSADCTVGICPQAQPFTVSEWLQQLQTSHMCQAENPNENIPFLTSKRTSPKSLPVDFYSSLRGQNRLTFLSWCVQNLGVAWQGSSGLVSHKATATQRPSGSELEDLLPRGLIHFAGQPWLAIGRRPRFPRLLQALLECPLASSRRNDPGE